MIHSFSLKSDNNSPASIEDRNSCMLLPMIIALAVLSYGKVLFLRDVFWDDNCWLLAEFSSGNLEQFLNTGFYEMRRELLGIFFYYFFVLHKISGHAFVIWQSMNLAIQILTPIFLFFFLRNLFEDRQLLSFFAAAGLVIFPLDYTLPYLSAINYRIAVLLTMISFYLMEKAFHENRSRWFFFISALLISGLSYYVFMEATIVFEPARLFVLGYVFHKKGHNLRAVIKNALKHWAPFFLLCIPLVFYKLAYKSYGIYGGKYKTDILFFLELKEHAKLIGMLLFYQVKVLSDHFKDVNPFSVLLSFLAAIICLFAAQRLSTMIKAELKTNDIWQQPLFAGRLKNAWRFVRTFFFAGLIFLLPAVLFLEFAKLEIGPGFNSSHFTIVQTGYAIIAGCFLYVLYVALINFNAKRQFAGLLIALIVGAGVFFNNLNLDLYSNSSARQNQFWKTFAGRFPSLPPDAIFLMDVRDAYYFDTADMDNTYDLEYSMNLLYADSDDPEKFRRYRVVALEEIKPEMTEKFRCNQVNEEKMERTTHFGKEELEPCEFIVVHYRNGELLVNREIKEKYPDVPYKMWLDKDFPQLPKPVSYPLRHKFKGLGFS